MSATYRTCTHIYDTGGICNSAAVKNHNYCAFHLHHRARVMRMAQHRARNQRLAFHLPPLENMHAVCSALNQISEAACAGMIDFKQARFLLSVVRAAGQFLLRAEKWPAASVFHSGEPAAEIDLAAQYGLPNDLNLDTPPEVAFPESTTGAPPLSAAFADRAGRETGNRQLPPDHSLPEMPFSGHYCSDHNSRECECCRIRADYPLTPEMVEVVEVTETYGPEVAAVRSRQLMRNTERRRLNREHKRYEAIALEKNMRRAADLIAERKLAERAKQEVSAANEAGAPPLSPSVGDRVGSVSTPKKPAASVDNNDAENAVAEAKSSA
jgi:hypothetical protein